MRTINKIIIHCSATPEGKPVTVEQIRLYHMNHNGWTDIGYHYVIYADGSIHPGRPVAQPGAHCKGHNADSIGICYVGGLTADGSAPKDTRTPQQKAAMVALVHQLRERYGQHITVHGHYEFANKACPCFKVFQSDFL